MRPTTARKLLLVAGLGVVVGLPLAGKWLRQGDPPRCERDGLPIVPLYRVRVVDRAGQPHLFCCVQCARVWLERRGEAPGAVRVTDEADGREIDPRAAHFVRSPVATSPITGNHVHVFRSPADAAEHARAFGGWVLGEEERPFRDGPSSPGSR
jgi:hypothetical protein